MNESPKVPYSQGLVEEVRKTLKQFDEGAITSPELCIHVLVALANYEKEVCDENDALTKYYAQ